LFNRLIATAPPRPRTHLPATRSHQNSNRVIAMRGGENKTTRDTARCIENTG
jgi:hypothetical protein